MNQTSNYDDVTHSIDEYVLNHDMAGLEGNIPAFLYGHLRRCQEIVVNPKRDFRGGDFMELCQRLEMVHMVLGHRPNIFLSDGFKDSESAKLTGKVINYLDSVLADETERLREQRRTSQ